MLRGSNYLDTRAAGSYNRRPLSLGTLAGYSSFILVFASVTPLFVEWSSKGIYGDDDSIDPDRPK